MGPRSRISCSIFWRRAFIHRSTCLQLPAAAIGAVLRRANEHFDEVVVQGVVKLALETPFKLRIVQVAGMKVEIVGVDGHAFVLEANNDFDAVSLAASRERQQRMLVEAQLMKHALEALVRSSGHGSIVQMI